MEVFKILKFRDPLVIYEQFKVSNRKSALLINMIPAKNFVSRGTKIWNTVTPKLKLADHCSTKIAYAKSNLKKLLLSLQSSADEVSWNSDNFNIEKMTPLSEKTTLIIAQFFFSFKFSSLINLLISTFNFFQLLTPDRQASQTCLV